QAVARVVFRILRLQPFADHRRLHPRLPQGRSRSQAGDGVEIVGAAAPRHAARDHERDPDVGPAWQLVVVGDDTGDGVRLAVQLDHPAERSPVTVETALPEILRDYRHPWRAGLVLPWGEPAAGQGAGAEDREERSADEGSLQPLRL